VTQRKRGSCPRQRRCTCRRPLPGRSAVLRGNIKYLLTRGDSLLTEQAH
jgi:hypothetical protein